VSDLRNVAFDPEKNLPPKVLAEWRAAEKAGETARDEDVPAKLAGEKIDWNKRQKIWSTFKRLLLEHAYYGKCGYCETHVSAGFHGDADHWRPKGAVTTLSPTGKRRRVEHEGYYWLAYCWQNIVPSCEKCNSDGKGTLFPIEGVHHTSPAGYPQPAELDAEEKPLILHPRSENDPPEDHIGFTELGQVFAIEDSPLGEHSIRVYGLKRLDTTRHQRQCEARDAVKRALKQAKKGKPFKETIPLFVGPRAPYSRAVLAYAHFELRRSIEKQQQDLANLQAVAAGAPPIR
jgi:hypothetical protein